MRVVGAVGRVLVTLGLLMLAFAAYQLWGTGLYEARAQRGLRADLERSLASTTTTRPASSSTSSTTVPAPPPAPTGEAVAIIRIPRIGVDRAVVQGVGRADLRKGPGHYPTTPLPGELGNAAIAGHRTTYGAPFNRLDELQVGDTIEVRTVAGDYRYAVTEQRIVKPTDLSVLDPTPTATLTLTTCNPKYSARQRLVVKAELVPTESGTVRTPSAAISTAPTNLDGPHGSPDTTGAIVWGVATLAVGLAWWAAFHRRRHWTTWVIGFLPFAAVCFVWFGHVDRALPGNF